MTNKLFNMRRLVSGLLLCLVLIGYVPKPVKALNMNSSLDIKQIVYSNVNKVTGTVNTFSDQRGALKSLQNIIISGLWVDYIFNNSEDGLDFSSVEQSTYYNSYKSKVSEFNSKFNDKSGEKYIHIVLPSLSDNQSQQEYVTLVNQVIGYVDSYFSKLNTEYSSKDENGKKLFLNENKIRIVSAYEVILRLNQEYEFLHSLTSKVDNPSLYTIDLSSLSKLLTKAQYLPFYNRAIEELERGINAVGEIKVSKGDDPISKFTAVDSNTSDKVESVNKAFLAAFSASSVYLPLESYVGNDKFVDALSFLANGDKEVLQAYTELSNYKKPLYIREYDESMFNDKKGETVGDARRVTIGELIEMVRDGKTGSLITIKGNFATTEDSDTYIMSIGNSVNRIKSGEGVGSYTKEDNKNTSEEDKKQENTTNDKKEDNEESKDPYKSGSEVIEYEGDSVALEEVITKQNFFTDPILTFGRKGMEAINSLLINNMYSNKNPNVNLSDSSFANMQLYVNPFGDIVLSDNKIVVPASSNASYYSDGSDIIYNPFTDAFMDSYPTIYKQPKFQASATDQGKIAVHSDTDGSEDSYTESLMKFKISSLESNLQGFIISSEEKIKGTGLFTEMLFNAIDVGMYDPISGEKKILFTPQKKEFKLFKGKFISGGRFIMCLDTNTITSDSLTVPLYPIDNSKGEEASLRNKYVVQSYYSTIVTNEDGSEANIANDRLNPKSLYNLMIEVFNGKQSVYGYEKGVYNSIADKEQVGGLSFITNWLKWLTNTVVDAIGSAPGMLGLRSATQDRIMGTFLYYVRSMLPWLVLIIVIVFLAMYSLGKDNFTFMIAKGALAIIVTIASIYVIPKYLSGITNYAINNGSNNLAFDSLKLRQEMMIDKSNVTASYSDFGRFGFATSSITLYAFTEDQLKDVCDMYDVEYLKISSGGSFVIDDGSGLFVQGDKLKINLDRMMNISAITTNISSVSNASFYKLEKTEHVSSVIDYYMPYNLIQDGFISKLNALSEVYQLTRSTLPYPRGIRKDNFFVDSYVQSPIFLSPRDPRETDPDMSEDLYGRIADKFLANSSGVGNEDFLGISKTLKDYLSRPDTKDTLWYQTMEQNGFFGLEEFSEKKYNNLIIYVNTNTRKFLVDNKDTLSYMSDENLIEITSLYATMLFNTNIGEFGNKAYPERINFEELSVVDTIRPVITKDYNKFTAVSRDIVKYVDMEYGWMGLIGLNLIVIFQGLTSLFLTYAIYIMYILLLIFLLVKFLSKKDSVTDTVKGFAKLYCILIVVYLINVWSFLLLNKFKSSGLTILFLVLISSAVLGLTSSVVYFTISGFGSMDFGNSKINATFGKFLSKLPFNGSIRSSSSKVGKFVADSFRTKDRDYDELGLRTTDLDVWRDEYEDSRAVKSYIDEKYTTHYEYNHGIRRPNSSRDYSRKNRRNNNITLEDDSSDLM